MENRPIDKIREPSYYHLKIKDWPEDERPREKLLKTGPQSLSDAELLAILIGSGTGGITAVDLAKRLLSEHGSLSALASRGVAELIRMKGIGQARGAKVMAAFEIGRRVESGERKKGIKANTPEDIFRLYHSVLRDEKKEIFKIVLLNSGNRIIKDVTVSQGTLNASLVHPREVFKAAVDNLAAGIILLHNHPSGESAPSSEDRKITTQLMEASKILDIPVLDHIIIGGDGFFSFANEGFLNR